MSLLAVGAVLEGQYDYSIVDGNLVEDALATLDGRIQARPPTHPGRHRHARPPTGAGRPPLPRAKTAPSPPDHRLGRLLPHAALGRLPAVRFVDYVVRGHGEYAFLQLLDWLNGRSLPLNGLADIPGLAYRDAVRHAGHQPAGPHPPSPKAAPLELRPGSGGKVRPPHLFRLAHAGLPFLLRLPFFCNFCAVVNMVNGRWLPQSAETVAHIAHEYRRRWGINAIEFYDNNFFTQEARVADFCRAHHGFGNGLVGRGAH
jgi:anaerobic magnesium-protoporphyrin IX monomethyl ester cyclase